MQDQENQESEQNEVDGIKEEAETRSKVLHIQQRSVICNEMLTIATVYT